MRYFVIDEQKQMIANVILVDPDNLPELGPGFRLSDTGGDIGDVWDGVAWVSPPPDLDALARAARAERDALLTASDWSQMPDAPVDRAAWAAYRQALRDVTAQEGFPTAIDWPTAP